MGSDQFWNWLLADNEISIHAARVGSDNTCALVGSLLRIFQSTLPVWAATEQEKAEQGSYLSFQSTLPVWAATRQKPPQYCI